MPRKKKEENEETTTETAVEETETDAAEVDVYTPVVNRIAIAR